MTRRLVLLLLLAAATVVGCGQSDQEKADATVCDARADIGREVDTLKQLTPETVTLDKVTTSVTAIGEDLKRIADAQGSLGDKRRKEIEAANQAFSAEIRQITSTVLRSSSVAEARAQLEGAVSRLAQAYSTSLAPIDCG